MLRAFLILTNLLSGTLSGITCCLGKLMIMVFVSPGVVSDPLSIFKMRCAWLLALCVNITVWSNLFNLNLTVSLYSQLITMPTYECCILLGTFMSGGVVMGEFSYYTNKQLIIILVGLCTCMSGIMYKVCMLENADIEKTTLNPCSLPLQHSLSAGKQVCCSRTFSLTTPDPAARGGVLVGLFLSGKMTFSAG